jgi:hypothetical protein
MMIRSILYAAIVTLLMLAFPSNSRAQAVINIRVSYKIILNPADGSRPILTGATTVSDADITTAINAMNTLLQTYFRGYRVQRVDPITNIGGMGDTTGPSRWFNTNFFGDNGDDLKNQMEAAAMSDARYRWNPNAINLYVVNGFCGGLCSFPGQGNMILVGGCSANSGAVQLHEMGHYFSLCHTQGCSCACGLCGTCAVGGTNCTAPGDDGMADTLPDLACWNQDDIARNSFGLPYAQLSSAQQNQVDNVFFNLMSYHGTCCSTGGAQMRLTELQLDRWADIASTNTGGRLGVCDGVTIFVEANAVARPGFRGLSTNPWPTIQAAQDDAANYLRNLRLGSILMLRPGAYNERLTLNTPMTLRATRQGPATIGSPTPLPAPAGPSQEEIEKKLRETPGIFSTEPVRLGFPGRGPKQPR